MLINYANLCKGMQNYANVCDYVHELVVAINLSVLAVIHPYECLMLYWYSIEYIET